MDTQFDLELLQRLLITSRCKVIDICIGYVVRLPKGSVPVVGDELLTEQIKLIVAIPHVPAIQNMVVVLTAVETDKSEFHQKLDVLRRWIDHLLDFV